MNEEELLQYIRTYYDDYDSDNKVMSFSCVLTVMNMHTEDVSPIATKEMYEDLQRIAPQIALRVKKNYPSLTGMEIRPGDFRLISHFNMDNPNDTKALVEVKDCLTSIAELIIIRYAHWKQQGYELLFGRWNDNDRERPSMD